MPNTPVLNARLTITAVSIAGNSVASVFNNVGSLNFDYVKGIIRVVDLVLGEAFFGLTTVTSISFTVVSGLNGTTSVVIS